MRSSRADGLSMTAAALVATGMAAAVLVAAPHVRAREPTDRTKDQDIARPNEENAARRPTALDPAEGAVAQAKRALERATRLRSAGDEARAKAADSLAREWAETARDITRAVTQEAKAIELRRKAVDAQARVERLRSLIEEEITRVGRLRAQLDQEGRSAPGGRTAVEVHDPEPSATSGARSPSRPPSTREKQPQKDNPGDVP